MTVSPTWIYRYIYADRAAGGSLFRCLRRRGRKRSRRGRDGSGRGVIPGQRDISERPAVVEEKTRAGDWEADTIIGVRCRGALVSLVDRATKLTLLQQVERRTSSLVRAAVIECLQPVSDMTHTITADNGKEFAEHAEVSRALDADFHFARPYRSCDRGLNEHTNGLAREQLPKSTDFRTIDPAEVRKVRDALNNRPRRCLGCRTPAEAFREAAEAAAGRGVLEKFPVPGGGSAAARASPPPLKPPANRLEEAELNFPAAGQPRPAAGSRRIPAALMTRGLRKRICGASAASAKS